MEDRNDIVTRMNQNFAQMSKSHKKIASYIMDHYDTAVFMTAATLGKEIGISESTVVRFASEVGYEGYPQLQRALQELIRNRLTAVQRMEVTTEQIGGSDVLSKVLGSDIENIRRTLEE